MIGRVQEYRKEREREKEKRLGVIKGEGINELDNVPVRHITIAPLLCIFLSSCFLLPLAGPCRSGAVLT